MPERVSLFGMRSPLFPGLKLLNAGNFYGLMYAVIYSWSLKDYIHMDNPGGMHHNFSLKGECVIRGFT
jgi:hypothetical protein